MFIARKHIAATNTVAFNTNTKKHEHDRPRDSDEFVLGFAVPYRNFRVGTHAAV